MPNFCDYTMAVAGRKDNVDAFVNIMNNNYDKEHMFRIFEATPYEYCNYGLYRKVYISGYCAWSVYCCMLPGPFTYYDDWAEDYKKNFDKYKEINAAGIGTNILELAKRLALKIEIYSEEPGMAFQERYLITNGTLREDIQGKFVSYPIDSFTTYKECKDFFTDGNGELPFTEKQFIELKNSGKASFDIKDFDFPDRISNKPIRLTKDILYRLL